MTAIILILLIILTAICANLAVLVVNLTTRVARLEGNHTRHKQPAVMVPRACNDLVGKDL